MKEDRKTIKMEKSLLDMLLYDYLSDYIFNNEENKQRYVNLPVFIKEYNETKGWNWNIDDDEEYPIDALDFIEAILLIKNTSKKGFYELCESLLLLAQETIDEKQELYIIDL